MPELFCGKGSKDELFVPQGSAWNHIGEKLTQEITVNSRSAIKLADEINGRAIEHFIQEACNVFIDMGLLVMKKMWLE
ncbi:hypothetical protein BX666DRAFT_2029380 [Dichotomocladium elegans]|nr:hypothetical protein BX666DRAFT_2029380 [Dichotomocladium elegans]